MFSKLTLQLNWRRLASLKVTFTELSHIVATNSKQRFVLSPRENPKTLPQITDSKNPSLWRIRASQGHSIAHISSAAIYQSILASEGTCPDFLVHGTDGRAWEQIQRTGGLKSMKRTHIHFADRLPMELPKLDEYFQNKSKGPKWDGDEVISGMRAGATIVIWVDVKKSLRAGVEWWRSANGVFLTRGLERERLGKEGKEWVLGMEFVKWVETRMPRADGQLLFGERVVGLRREFDGKGEKEGDGQGKDEVTVAREAVEGRKEAQVERMRENWDDGE